MNKLLKSLVLAALAISASHLQAHTNKTTLMPRSHGVNMALEQGGGFRELVMRRDKNRFGGNFQAAFFYEDSREGADLAKYFLIKEKSQITVNRAAAATRAFGATDDIDLGLMVHQNNGVLAAAGVRDTIKLDPNHNAYGVYLNYHQDLEKILKGLFFTINLPVVHVENDVRLSVEGSLRTNDLRNYLRGEYEVAAGGANSQAKLQRAILGGKDSATGIADIDLQLGYTFLDKECYNACLHLGLTIPTGNEIDGKRAFQAVYGNGKHFGFGGGLNFGARVWGDHHHNIKLHAGANYRYLFEATEKRTLGVKDVNFAQYMLLLKHGQANNTQLTPAANVLTQNVNVTPGSQFDGVVNFAYNNGGFTLDAGYNLYFREAESVKTKDKLDGRYGIASSNVNMTALGGPADFAAHAPVLEITAENLSTAAAENPSQTSHKVYGNVGYIFRNWETPVNLAAGAHYEFAGSNATVAGWGFNVRAGISF